MNVNDHVWQTYSRSFAMAKLTKSRCTAKQDVHYFFGSKTFLG